MNSLSKRLKAARVHYNYTQKELSEKCGVSQQSINKLEMGKVFSPRKKALRTYAEALLVNESWLLFGERPPSWAVDFSEETNVTYVRSAISVLGTTELFTPDNKVGYARILIDSPNAFGLRSENPTAELPYRLGTVLGFNPDIKLQSNDVVMFANPDSKPIIGILATIYSSDEYFIEYRNPDTGSILVNPNDYQISAVMESIGRPRCFFKEGSKKVVD